VHVRARVVIGVVLCLVGALWFSQGVGWFGGSFMSGQAVWAVIGVVTVLFGITLLCGAKRARRGAADPGVSG
jgi:hypothetical protein